MQSGTEHTLNLARKWRSKQFNQVIGQEISVRLVKNALYRNILFPVYLLSGTRGCGKTTMGRLLAAAVNCEQLSAFQKNPQQVELPCLTCLSCVSMQQSTHPDFIELDAASHTGVDTIRQLIEGTSFAPVMSGKKVYLIDEAHMLSKAAFNALLKVLEEPPAGVMFLLATTDPHKIIDTVRSRCFQLFFNPISIPELIDHLAFICTQEKIAYNQDALAVIAHETEGTIRDALNLLERARLVQGKVSKDIVLRTLGFCSEEKIIDLLHAILSGNAEQLMAHLGEFQAGQFDIVRTWKKFIELIRVSLWLSCNVSIETTFVSIDRIKQLLTLTNYNKLVWLLEICCQQEQAFSKTAFPLLMFEMLLLKLLQSHAQGAPEGKGPIGKNTPIAIANRSGETSVSTKVVAAPVAGPWGTFLKNIESVDDPLVGSIFKQARFAGYDEKAQIVTLVFSKEVSFFKEWVMGSEKSWKPFFTKVFGDIARCELEFTDAAVATPVAPVQRAPVPTLTAQPAQEKKTEYKPVARYAPQSREMALDVKDSNRWARTNMVLQLFPGTVTQLIN